MDWPFTALVPRWNARHAHRPRYPLFLPPVVLILLPSLHPDALYLEEVISLALDRIDGVDSDSSGASTKLPRSAT